MAQGAGGRGHGPSPVEVIYFPKREGGDSRDDGARTPWGPSTQPELPATKIAAQPTRSSRRDTPRARPARGRKPKPPKRPRPAGEQEVSTDPGVPEPLPSGGMSRAQIAEMSVFGHHLFQNGRLEEARVVFEGLVGIGVREAFPHTMLGTIYLATGDMDRALELFEAALTLDPGDLAARVYRGELRLGAGRRRAAVSDLEHATRQGPADDPFVERAAKLLQLARQQPPGRGKR